MAALSLPAREPKGLLAQSPMPALALTSGIDVAGLMGVPHLLGHILDTREGFTVVPIGPVTLQPDGRIIGHPHPQEGSRVRYALGTGGADNAFARLPAPHSGLPKRGTCRRRRAAAARPHGPGSRRPGSHRRGPAGPAARSGEQA